MARHGAPRYPPFGMLDPFARVVIAIRIRRSSRRLRRWRTAHGRPVRYSPRASHGSNARLSTSIARPSCPETWSSIRMISRSSGIGSETSKTALSKPVGVCLVGTEQPKVLRISRCVDILRQIAAEGWRSSRPSSARPLLELDLIHSVIRQLQRHHQACRHWHWGSIPCGGLPAPARARRILRRRRRSYRIASSGSIGSASHFSRMRRSAQGLVRTLTGNGNLVGAERALDRQAIHRLSGPVDPALWAFCSTISGQTGRIGHAVPSCAFLLDGADCRTAASSASPAKAWCTVAVSSPSTKWGS